MRRSGDIDAATGHAPRDHICWLHDGEDAWRAAAIPYLSEGVEAGDQVLYVADKPADALLDDLGALPGRDALLGTRQLRVMSVAEAYGPVDRLAATRQLEAFHREALAAVAAGYRGLRLASEATVLVQTPEQARRFSAYELLVDAMVARSPLSAMCGYDTRRIRPEAAGTLSFVHPLRQGGDGPSASGFHADDGGHWRLSGEIDLAVGPSLDLALATLPADADVHLELGDLRFIDVAGARELVSLAERLAPGRRLVLHRAPEALLRLLEMAWPRLPDALEATAA